MSQNEIVQLWGLKQMFPETLGSAPSAHGRNRPATRFSRYSGRREKAKDGRIGAPAQHTTGKAFGSAKVRAEKYRFMRSVGLFGVEPAIEPRAERAAQPPFLSIHRRPGTSNNGR